MGTTGRRGLTAVTTTYRRRGRRRGGWAAAASREGRRSRPPLRLLPVGARRRVGALPGERRLRPPPTLRRRSRGSSPDGIGALSARRRAAVGAFRTGTRLRRLFSVGRAAASAARRGRMRLRSGPHLFRLLSVGARRPGGAQSCGSRRHPLPLYCTQFRNSFLASASDGAPRAGTLCRGVKSSIQLNPIRDPCSIEAKVRGRERSQLECRTCVF